MDNKKIPFTLPPCGILVGNAIYNVSGLFPSGSGWAGTSWQGQRGNPCDLVRRTVAENQGNIVQFWWKASRRPRAQIFKAANAYKAEKVARVGIPGGQESLFDFWRFPMPMPAPAAQ